MNSLKELIQQGDYELAAYRLIYGVVHASAQDLQPHGARGRSRVECGRAEKPVKREGSKFDG